MIVIFRDKAGLFRSGMGFSVNHSNVLPEFRNKNAGFRRHFYSLNTCRMLSMTYASSAQHYQDLISFVKSEDNKLQDRIRHPDRMVTALAEDKWGTIDRLRF